MSWRLEKETLFNLPYSKHTTHIDSLFYLFLVFSIRHYIFCFSVRFASSGKVFFVNVVCLSGKISLLYNSECNFEAAPLIPRRYGETRKTPQFTWQQPKWNISLRPVNFHMSNIRLCFALFHICAG